MTLAKPFKTDNMKFVLLCLTLIISSNLLAQRNKSFEINRSDYVIAKFQNFSKTNGYQNGLQFINTSTGKIKKLEFPEDAFIQNVLEVSIDSLEINLVLVISGERPSKRAKFEEQSTIATYTPDGILINSVTINQGITDYVVNRKNGRLVIILNNDKKKSSEIEIVQTVQIFDLRTLAEIKTK